MSFLEELLLNLQVVVITGLSIVSSPQLSDDQITPESFTDFCVFTITLLVASRQLLFSAANEQVVGDTMASTSLLGLVIWSEIMINFSTWSTSIHVFKSWFHQHFKSRQTRIWNTDIISSSALSVS